MTPEEVPAALKAIVDRAAGKEHSAAGPVMACVADLLTAHRRMVRIEMVAAGWESPEQIEQDTADRFRFADLLSWQLDVHRSKPGHGNLDRRGCQTCQQFAEISEHPAIVAAREERMRAVVEALRTGNYVACPLPEERGEG